MIRVQCVRMSMSPWFSINVWGIEGVPINLGTWVVIVGVVVCHLSLGALLRVRFLLDLYKCLMFLVE